MEGRFLPWHNTVSENPFCVADFATLSDDRRSRSKIFLLFIWIKEFCVRKFEGLARSKLFGISQTEYDLFGFPLENIQNMSKKQTDLFSMSSCIAIR